MNKRDWPKWQEKTKKINANRSLKLGDRVVDLFGWKGIVVKIKLHTTDNKTEIVDVLESDNKLNGTIYVWQEDRTEYGADNCEHYCIRECISNDSCSNDDAWKEFLRPLK